MVKNLKHKDRRSGIWPAILQKKEQTGWLSVAKWVMVVTAYAEKVVKNVS